MKERPENFPPRRHGRGATWEWADAGPAFDPHVLRPTSAVVISVVAWALAAFYAVDAVVRGGPAAVLPFLPFLLLAAAIIYAIFWAPRVLVWSDRAEVRNIFRSHRAHYAAVEDVKIGAMVSMTARADDGSPRTIVAWNAPGLKRDKEWAEGALSAQAGGWRRTPAANSHGSKRAKGRTGRGRGDSDPLGASAILYRSWDAWDLAHPRGNDADVETPVVDGATGRKSDEAAVDTASGRTGVKSKTHWSLLGAIAVLVVWCVAAVTF